MLAFVTLAGTVLADVKADVHVVIVLAGANIDVKPNK